MAKRWTFNKAVKEFKKQKRTLPRVIGNMVLNHQKQAFRRQGFTDRTLDPWVKRKTKDRSDRRNKRSRAILVKSGALRRSLRVKRATFANIRVGSYGIIYSRPHNRGVDPQPKRQFIGQSRVLSKKIEKRIDKELKTIYG